METEYDKNSDVPFGFFMNVATFRTKIVGDSYISSSFLIFQYSAYLTTSPFQFIIPPKSYILV